DRTFWRSGNPDLSRLLQNTVRWLRGDRTQPVAIEGEGLLEAFAWETEPGYTLHLLNYTTPNLTWGLVDRSYAVGPQRVRFEVAHGRQQAPEIERPRAELGVVRPIGYDVFQVEAPVAVAVALEIGERIAAPYHHVADVELEPDDGRVGSRHEHVIRHGAADRR